MRTNDTFDKTVDQYEERIRLLRGDISELGKEIDRLVIALHDAIRLPMGVVPDSADEWFYTPMDIEAEERRKKSSRNE